jgi:hypothetical protein
MTNTNPTASVRLRLLVPAALLAAALGASTLTDPAIASAEREWDIGIYDACVENVFLGGAGFVEAMRECCINSGGVWDDDRLKCGAPPAEDAERTSPPRVAPPAETSAPLETSPVTPPTFAPGPAKQG